MLTDIQIAQEATLLPITEIAKYCNIDEKYLEPYGKYKAKISIDILQNYQKKTNGKLILVTAINPTVAGEGKSTVSIGLTQALCKLGEKAIVTLREPSLGPVFGVKGGATGGGRAQVLPMEDINLHFTGDMHAVTSAHNLIAAAIDNHIYQGNHLEIDIKKITWKRTMDMNDRALRHITIYQDENSEKSRESSFQITAASEIMAILCLSNSLQELKTNISSIIFGYSKNNTPLKVEDLKITGAASALLKDAINPNLVQTLENTPAIIHGGPFANIAHGCNSIIATKIAMKLADYVVTEAGFGADLGAEKFLNIKCRKAGIKPSAIVIVATIRALKYHGDALDFSIEDTDALKKGLKHLGQHIENMQKFQIPVIVAINRFITDTLIEEQIVSEYCNQLNIPVSLCEVWSKGGEGGEDLATKVLAQIEKGSNNYTPLYQLDEPIKTKISKIVKGIYRAKDIKYLPEVEKMILQIEELGYQNLPICISKTQKSFSDNPKLKGCPEDFTFTINNIRLAAGAGYIIVMSGTIIDMPGLPVTSAMEQIEMSNEGIISGLS